MGNSISIYSFARERINRMGDSSRRFVVVIITVTSITMQAWWSLYPKAQAQVLVPDTALSTQVASDETLSEFAVTGGRIEGVNLFHGFETFSPADWSVRFDLTATPASSSIERIFSRVTGDQPSIINGALSIVGGNNPDLFLLNPNGILFGPDAQLNLAGSFIGTTANAIQFADGQNFSATLLDSPPLLSISTPIGLQLGPSSGAIRVVGNGHNAQQDRDFQWRVAEPITGREGLTIAPGNTLALVGGSVQFEGGQVQPRSGISQTSPTSSSWGTRLEIGAASNGVVSLQPEPRGWSLGYDAIQAFEDISLTNRSWLNSSSVAPSDIQIRGQNITLDQSSSIFLVNLGDQPNGNLEVFASGLLKIRGGGDIASYLQNVTLGPGRGGDTRVVSDRLELLDGGAILALTTGAAGNAGRIDIDVTDTLQINGLSGVATPTANPTVITNSTFGSGNVGGLEISARSISLENGGIITSSTLGSGEGEVVRIEAEEQISLRGINPLSSINSNISAVSLSTGNAGEELRIRTRRLAVLDGATISTDALGSGNSGSITIEAEESIRIGGSNSVLSQQPAEISSAVIVEDPVAALLTSGEASGDSGSVTLQTPRLELFDGGQVAVSNQGLGDAGDLEIQAQTVDLSGQAKIVATTEVGQGGNIRLSAERALTLRDRSEISVTANGELRSGNIFIQTPQLIAIPEENSDITANAVNSFGGDIEIDAAIVLGLDVEPRQTPQSDITASSERGAQFSGSVEFSQANMMLQEGISILPSPAFGSDEALAFDACLESQGEFSQSGRSGLPLGPSHLLHDPLLPEAEEGAIAQGIGLRNQGFYTKAMQLFLADPAASSAASHVQNPLRRVIVLRQLGITYSLLNRYEASRGALEQSLRLAQQLTQSSAEQQSATLLSLGNLARAENNNSAARLYYHKALAQNPASVLRQTIQANQLSLALTDGQMVTALSLITELLRQPIDDDLSEAQSGFIIDMERAELTSVVALRLNIAATLLQHQPSLQEQKLYGKQNWLQFLRQTLALAKSAEDDSQIAYALGHLGQAHEQAQQWQLAQQFSQAALQQTLGQRNRFQEYQWTWQLGRILTARWLATGDETLRSQARVAYETSLQALQQLRGELATLSPTLQFSFRNQIEPVYREYVSLLLPQQSNQTEIAIPAQDLQAALNTIEALKLAELDNFFQDDCLNSTPRSIENLDNSAAVIYPIVLADRIEVILSHRGELERYSLLTMPDNFQALIQDFRSSLVQRSRRDYQQLGQQLHAALIQPLLADLQRSQIQTLVFVPDQSLKNVPMAALFDGEEYLIEQFNVVVAPGLELLPGGSQTVTQPKALLAGITKRHQGFPPLTLCRSGD